MVASMARPNPVTGRKLYCFKVGLSAHSSTLDGLLALGLDCRSFGLIPPPLDTIAEDFLVRKMPAEILVVLHVLNYVKYTTV